MCEHIKVPLPDEPGKYIIKRNVWRCSECGANGYDLAPAPGRTVEEVDAWTKQFILPNKTYIDIVRRRLEM